MLDLCLFSYDLEVYICVFLCTENLFNKRSLVDLTRLFGARENVAYPTRPCAKCLPEMLEIVRVANAAFSCCQHLISQIRASSCTGVRGMFGDTEPLIACGFATLNHTNYARARITFEVQSPLKTAKMSTFDGKPLPWTYVCNLIPLSRSYPPLIPPRCARARWGIGGGEDAGGSSRAADPV